MFRDEFSHPQQPSEPAPPREAPGLPLEPRRLLRALLEGRRLLLGSMAVAGLLGALVGKFVVPKSYRASAALLWQPPASGRSDAAREVTTVAQSVKVQANLLKVRERLRLTSTLERLAQDVDVAPGESSHIVSISARSASRDAATTLAQAVVDVFLESQQEQARERLDEVASALRRSLSQAEEAQAAARGRYDAFRAEHRVDDFPSEVQRSIAEAARLRAAVGDVSVELRSMQARLDALRGSKATASDQVVLARSEHNDDRARLGQLESELVGLRSRFTDEHPRVRAAQAEVEALKGRSGSPPTVVGQTVGRNPLRDALAAQVEESSALRKSYAERARVLADLQREAEERAGRLTQVQGEAARLLAEVQANEDHIAVLHKQLAMAEDDVRGATSGFQVLSRPVPPERSEKGYGRIVALVVPLVALVVASLWLLARELSRGAVRASSEAAYWSGGPVIWAAPWPSGSPSSLVRELADALEGRCGVVALLGLDGAPSSELATLISERLSARRSPVSLWDAREQGMLGEDCGLDGCDDPALGRRLRARAKSRLVLLVGLDAADPEQLRAISRWFDSLLVLAVSGSTRALSLRQLSSSLPRLEGKIAVALLNAPEGLGAPEIRAYPWPITPPPEVAQRVQKATSTRRKSAPRGAPPCTTLAPSD